MEPDSSGSVEAALIGAAGVSVRADAYRPLQPQARRVSLLRLLLLSIALGIVLFFEFGKEQLIPDIIERLHAGLIVLAGVSTILVIWVNLVRSRWQLALLLVFDLLWVGVLIYYTGGVASPAVVLLFAIILIANLELSGVMAFAMPALASLVLAGNAVLYVAAWYPFPASFMHQMPGLVDNARVLGVLAIQVAALFLVDLLGQLLASRILEQRLFTGVLLDQLGEGVLAVDLHGAIVYANAEVARLLGLDDALQGASVRRILSGYPEVLTLVQGQGHGERSQRIQNRYLVLRAHDLLGRAQRRIGRTLVVADETRLRLLQDNARRAEHLAQLGEMAAGIAHEVRNPLTSLRGCAQELSDICHRFGHADAAALARIMVDESDRLARIVSDFLALSRLRSPVRRPVALLEVFKELSELSRHRSDLPPGIELRLEVEQECPEILADADQVRQVISNLLNNSLDAVINTPSPQVSCRARLAHEGHPLEDPAVEITVVDNGCGIPQELHERVFAPFFSTKSQGTGLGLSMVSRIVRAHGGVLTLDSITAGGTMITLILPAIRPGQTYIPEAVTDVLDELT
jgi:nitrogen-specific signal transduction histidine kinase